MKGLTETNIHILQAYADNGMNINQTARSLFREPTNVWQHLNRVYEVTGLDPRNRHDLIELLKCKNETFKKYSSLEEEAIRKWDEFVTPIREEFGIPRYRPKPATIDKNGKVKW